MNTVSGLLLTKKEQQKGSERSNIGKITFMDRYNDVWPDERVDGACLL
jgi:hypothetical protein